MSPCRDTARRGWGALCSWAASPAWHTAGADALPGTQLSNVLSLALLPWHPFPSLLSQGAPECRASTEEGRQEQGSHPLQHGVSQGPTLQCSTQAHLFLCLVLFHPAWSIGKGISSVSAQENRILCQWFPWHISENLSGHILVLGKHLYYATKAVSTKTSRGARKGPLKLSVPHAEVPSDQLCLKWPSGFSLDEHGPKLGWGLWCVDCNEAHKNAAGSLL